MKPIRTEEDYHMALVRLQLLKDAKPNTPEADEYEVINILLEHYERENAPMGMPDPIDSIKIFTEYFTDKNDDDTKDK
ncbi:hypothetical protein LNQ81_16870 [Myroides sp. M-43]|uniref:hypothetical protein n=1 Tax=Myroides oncorhynchi TaxID=2893756 RepID=UPI001E361FFA|nr:hypothetical protein [Myroides oncorhynchi]MCC9044347.1 hypothetical protein [Myroides oncorhynchi]